MHWRDIWPAILFMLLVGGSIINLVVAIISIRPCGLT